MFTKKKEEEKRRKQNIILTLEEEKKEQKLSDIINTDLSHAVFVVSFPLIANAVGGGWGCRRIAQHCGCR